MLQDCALKMPFAAKNNAFIFRVKKSSTVRARRVIGQYYYGSTNSDIKYHMEDC